MPKNIITDASCLILLEKIGELEILKKLFGSIIVSPTVAEEYGLPLKDWIKVKQVKNQQYHLLLKTSVDPGEASIIALAVDIGGLLVLDDHKARELALQLKLDYTGSLGILVDAKQEGYIKSLKKVLNKIKQTDFYITEELEMKLLEMAGE